MISAGGRVAVLRPMNDAYFWLWCREQRKKLIMRRVQEQDSESDSWERISEKHQRNKSDDSQSQKIGILKFGSSNSSIKANNFSSLKAKNEYKRT